MANSNPPKPKPFAPVKQRRLDALLEKNQEGTISPPERKRLEQLVTEAEQLMVENAQRLVEYSKQNEAKFPAASVPVTIWVTPQSTES